MLENETSDDAARAAEETTTTAGAAGTGGGVTGGGVSGGPEVSETPAAGGRTRRRAASRPAGPPPDFDDLPPAPAATVGLSTASTAQTGASMGETMDSEDAVGAESTEEPVEDLEAAEEAEAEEAEETDEADAGPSGAPQVPGVPMVPGVTGVSGVPAVPGAVPVVPRSASAAHTSGRVQEPFGVPAVTFQPPMVVFQPPEPVSKPSGGVAAVPQAEPAAEVPTGRSEDVESGAGPVDEDELAEGGESEDAEERPSRRRRRRGGRGRGRVRDSQSGEEDETDEESEQPASGGRAERGERGDKSEKPEKQGRDRQDRKEKADASERTEAAEEHGDADGEGAAGTRRRRRRRRRTSGADGEELMPDDPPNTVVHVREARVVADEVQSVRGSTRLEAKKQRRREGREQGRRRPPIITESEFLARRESVERTMVVRRRGERTQIAVLEDDVLVEHYVDRASHQSYVGNVYLGKVQNVLPSMEAAFVDIGKGRNAVLYAGEVNWDVAGLEGQPRRIESALKSGQSVLVQVTKDPLGHKGARLTSQVSLPGRYLVYVPDGSMTGISRKLPDKERSRLKQILKRVMPENAGVIVRTAAEGASEEELALDINRLAQQWTEIQRKAKTAAAPALLYGEPDLTVRVIRDVFNEDFSKLVVSGDEAWDMVQEYVEYVAPQLAERAERWDGDQDVLAAYRIDEQIGKALERKVWLPSGGSLVIDRTEAMTVVDVNTGKFTGQGGNLEETVTRNNLEAAEEIVRQLRLRDIGGIIVIDFIDMVLENNRDLVMRRLLECLSRDRTKHQVAEVTSLGLVQMTRKRVGQGLLEAFSEVCESCNGRGIHVSTTPVEHTPEKDHAPTGRKRKRKGEIEKAVEDKLVQAESARSGEGKGQGGAKSGGRKQGGRRSEEPAAAVAAAVASVAKASEAVESGRTDEVREASEATASAVTSAAPETAESSGLFEVADVADVADVAAAAEAAEVSERPGAVEAVETAVTVEAETVEAVAEQATADAAVPDRETVPGAAGLAVAGEETGRGVADAGSDIGPGAGEAEPGADEAGSTADEVTGSGSGRRRRPRRFRAKAEAAADE